MSEDWLVTSRRPLATEDLLMSVRDWADQVSIRVDGSQMCTVVVDHLDHVVLWLAPSQRVHEPADALTRNGLTSVTTAEHEAMWWTEVIQPAARHTGWDVIVEAGSVASALARLVDGNAHCLSVAPGEANYGTASVNEDGEDIACDLMSDTCAIFLQSRSVLTVTAWVSIAMAWAAHRSLTPVFLTPASTQLSPVMHHFARRGGCLWVRQGAEGMHNGATGSALTWARGAFVDTPGAPWPVALSGGWEVVYEGEVLHTDTSRLHIGRLAEATHEACGIEGPRSWGVLEPTSEAWSLAEMTEHARQASPVPSRMFFRTPSGDGIVTVLPQPVGVQESLTWVAPADDVMPRSTHLGRLGERLLQAGSDVALLGYRRPSVAAPARVGSTGTVLPGVICFKPGRFGGLDANTLDLPADSGVLAYATNVGVVVTFPVPEQFGDAATEGLLAAWDDTLSTLAQRNSIYAAYHAHALSAAAASQADALGVEELA